MRRSRVSSSCKLARVVLCECGHLKRSLKKQHFKKNFMVDLVTSPDNSDNMKTCCSQIESCLLKTTEYPRISDSASDSAQR